MNEKEHVCYVDLRLGGADSARYEAVGFWVAPNENTKATAPQ